VIKEEKKSSVIEDSDSDYSAGEEEEDSCWCPTLSKYLTNHQKMCLKYGTTDY
jgi:hypothetical protein